VNTYLSLFVVYSLRFTLDDLIMVELKEN